MSGSISLQQLNGPNSLLRMNRPNSLLRRSAILARKGDSIYGRVACFIAARCRAPVWSKGSSLEVPLGCSYGSIFLAQVLFLTAKFCHGKTNASKKPISRYACSIFLLTMSLTIGHAPVFGADELPAEIVVEDLLPENGGTGVNGIYVRGAVTTDKLGESVAAAGDFNGDGIDDFVVGATRGANARGAAYVVYGTTAGFPPAFRVTDLLPENGGDGSIGVVLNGVSNNDAAGSSVAGIGDINDDGIDDVAVGAPNVDFDFTGFAGATYVVFGSITNLGAQINLSSLLEENGGDGTRGFAVLGDSGGAFTTSGDYSGKKVRKAGDVNGDGIADLLVSAHNAALTIDGVTLPDAGQAYLLFGSATPYPASFFWSDLEPENGGDGSRGVVFNGSGPSDRLGEGLNFIGDFNGDGLDDIALGATAANYVLGADSFGSAYIIYGSSDPWPPVIVPSSMLPSNGGDGSLGLVIESSEFIRNLGLSIGSIGDFNNDGFSDVAIGAARDDESTASGYDGVAYVIFGRNNFSSPVFYVSSLLENNGGTGDQGFVIHRIEDGDKLAAALGGGDFDNDGFSDILLGAPKFLPRSGEAYVVYGNGENNVAEFELSSLLVENGADGQSGLIVLSDSAGFLGQSVATIGDVNNDGFTDFAAGNTSSNSHDGENGGSVAILFGKPRLTLVPDTDFDGILNENDNCLLVHNPLQEDTDGDGYGNICDADFNNNCAANFFDFFQLSQQFLSSSALVDLNSDGVVNFLDVNRFSELLLEPVGPSGLVDTCD